MMELVEVFLSNSENKEVPPKVELPPVAPGLMSLEELDRIIIENDAEALSSLDDLKSNAELNSQTIEIFQYDELLEKQRRKNQFILKLKLKTTLFLTWLKSRGLESFQRFLLWSKQKSVEAQEGKKAFSQKARTWTWKEKSLFASFLVLLTGLVAFIYFAFVKKSFFHDKELFITSLTGSADKVWALKTEDLNDFFYNTVRVPKNIFNLRRMVINVQSSESSGENPMVALELSLEATSREALVEIKDREGEILDGVQRSLEELTFDELSGDNSKALIEEKVGSRVNSILTLGKVRSVYIVGLIFKR